MLEFPVDVYIKTPCVKENLMKYRKICKPNVF